MKFVVALLFIARLSAASLANPGEDLFKAKCESCHSVGEGAKDYTELAGTKGPSLRFAGSKYKPGFVAAWLENPYRIRPSGYLPFRYVTPDPAGDKIDAAQLPVHMRLAKQDAANVAAFLDTLKAEPNQFPQAQPDPDMDASVHFTKILGCGSCHQSAPGEGGVSGPELMTMAQRFAPDWFQQLVTDPVHWGPIAMPKINIRADQLATIASFLENVKAAPIAAKATSVKAVERAVPERRVEVIYQLFCTQCHGVTGNGKGINSTHLFVAPRNHTSVTEMGALTDDRLYAVIRYGGASVGKSVLMPSWGAILKDADIKLLVEYLRELSGTQQAMVRASCGSGSCAE